MTHLLSPLAELVASIAALSDKELLGTVEHLAQAEQHATAHLVASLAELDRRRLYRDAGCSSLFTYCTQRLHLSEHAAYRRIEAARVARRFPLILERLSEGAVTLTAVGLVAEHLTPENHVALLDQIRHQSKRAVESLVAALVPRPDVPASVRRLPQASHSQPVANGSSPTATPGCVSQLGLNAGAPVAPVVADSENRAADRSDCGDGAAAAGLGLLAPQLAPAPNQWRQRPTILPTAPGRYRVQMTISGETYAKLRRAQDLLRHAVPDGDVPAILDRALALLVAGLEKTRMAATSRPAFERASSERAASRPRMSTTDGRSRHIPAAVKRAVWARDQERCTFEGRQGRCTETGMLELHHRVPFAVGGSTDAANLELRCRAHNLLDADLFFGISRSVSAGRPAAGAT